VKRKPVIAVIGAGKGLGGIMEGVAKGAKEANGQTIGILPTENKEDANEFIDYVIPTGFGEARNIIVVRSADAVVAFPGKYGTLTEMAFALNVGKPVVSVNAWKLGDEIIHVENPVEAAKLAMELAEKKQ